MRKEPEGSPTRRKILKDATLSAALIGLPNIAFAQDASGTLRALSTQQINVLDVASPSRTLAVFGAALLLYARLLSFKVKPTENGFQEADALDPVGELAESWTISDDFTRITFKLRPDSVFHDGSRVTAEDVKWSIDRAIDLLASKNFMKGAGIEDPSQISVTGPDTVAVQLVRPNRLALSVFVSPLVPVFNSKVAKKHATADDPWAIKWLEANVAGGGAYKIEEFKPSEQIIYRRHDGWTAGEKPHFERIVYQTVPEASSIIALMERGRADFTIDVPLKDIPAIAQRGALATGSVTLRNSIDLVAMNTRNETLKDRRVRQAIAHAMPYDAIHQSVYNGTGEMLNCGAPLPVKEARYPQAYPYCTDIDKAKALLAEAGHPGGIDLTFTFETTRASTFEPMAVLMRESLAKAGIRLTIQKMVGGQFAQAMTAQSLQFIGYVVNAWLGAIPDYWFRTFFSGVYRDNFGNFDDARLNALLNENAATFDQAKYDEQIRQMITIAMEELPILPIRRRTIDVVQAKNVAGFTSWFHGATDLRQIRKT